MLVSLTAGLWANVLLAVLNLWVVLGSGAEILEGWLSVLYTGWLESSLWSAQMLRLYAFLLLLAQLGLVVIGVLFPAYRIW